MLLGIGANVNAVVTSGTISSVKVNRFVHGDDVMNLSLDGGSRWVWQPMTNQKTISILTRLWIALLAAAPFFLLTFLFLADSYQWTEYLFGYMGIVVAAPVVFAGLAVYAFLEYRIRRSAKVMEAPSFAFAGGLLLLGFFVPATVANPILLNYPEFCRVTRSIKWDTTKPHPEWNTNHSFILVVIGTGTAEQHQFSSGYMNWTGPEPAGFSSIRFQPLSFNAKELADQMSASGLSDDELATLSSDIWATCDQIDAGGPLKSESGVVDSIYCHVDDQWDSIIGGWIWMLLLGVVFLLVGATTI